METSRMRQLGRRRRWPFVIATIVVAAVVSLGGGAEADPDPDRETTHGPAARPTQPADGSPPGAADEYDPWVGFNERTFAFNYELDRAVMKPVARAWAAAVPEELQTGLKNAFDNVGMPRRFVHHLLQGRVRGALAEISRFVLNSTLGIGGLFDVARTAGLEAQDEDAGQTLAVWGVGPGPYLVLPFFPPTTVRDGLGSAVDSVLDPLSYVAPLAASLGTSVGERVNSRARHLTVFEDVEEGALDLYSAVRNGYLQRRARQIER